MNTLLTALDTTGMAVLRCSVQATVLIPVVLAIRWLSGSRLGVSWRPYLGWIVVGRLLLPWSPEAPFSLFGFVGFPRDTASTVAPDVAGPDGAKRADPSIPRTVVAPAVVTASSEGPRVPEAARSVESTDSRRGAWGVRLLGIVWGTGFAGVLGVTVLDTLRFRRFVRRRTTEAGPETAALLETCRRQMGVRVRVAVRLGPWVRTPAVWGFWKPTVLLPADVEAWGSRARLRHVLLHEMAHLARHDLRWGLLLRCAHALHWFNPAVPWLLRRMRLDREIATDAKVLEVTGSDARVSYGETLLMLLAGRPERATFFGNMAVGSAECPADMEARIRAIAAFTPARGKARLAASGIVALALVCWTDATTPATSETEAPVSANLGAVVALLPRGEELGPGWSNRVTSLVDRGIPAREYFDSGVREPARNAIRSHVAEDGAFCDVSYFRDGAYVFDAWLRRRESTKQVDDEWQNLRSAVLLPRLSDGKVGRRSVRRVGDLEAILYEGDSRTLWLASGRWILNLNLHAKMTTEDVFSMAGVFARRLGGGRSASVRPDDGRGSDEEDGRYAVQFAPDAYTSVRKVHTNRVAVSRGFTRPDDAHVYFTITNAERVPILVWNVRVQTRNQGVGGADDGWKTVSSDYPSCVSGVLAGTTGDACVLPPPRGPWRVVFLYTAQALDGRPIPDFPPHLRGDHEMMGPVEDSVPP